jgi:hypothetical protein
MILGSGQMLYKEKKYNYDVVGNLDREHGY